MTHTSEQEIFNIAYTGLKAQGFVQSTRRVEDARMTIMAYRGDDGRKCAIGFMIPDENYSLGFEEEDVTNSSVRDAAGIDLGQVEFAHDLQRIHDTCDKPDIMESRLRKFAANRGLEVPA